MKRFAKYLVLFIIFLIIQLAIAGVILLLDKANFDTIANAPSIADPSSSSPDVGPLLTIGLFVIIDVAIIAPIISVTLFSIITRLLKKLNSFWSTKFYQKAIIVFVGSFLIVFVYTVYTNAMANIMTRRTEDQLEQDRYIEQKGYFFGATEGDYNGYYMDSDGNKVDVPKLPSPFDPVNISDLRISDFTRMFTEISFYIELTTPLIYAVFNIFVLTVNEGIVQLIIKLRKKN